MLRKGRSDSYEHDRKYDPYHRRSSGIGRGLAEEFHKLRNRVIIAGRRREVLDAVTGANPGMKSAAFDMQNLAELPGFAVGIARQYPSLNVLINNAGIMKAENLQEEAENFATAEAIVTTCLRRCG